LYERTNALKECRIADSHLGSSIYQTCARRRSTVYGFLCFLCLVFLASRFLFLLFPHGNGYRSPSLSTESAPEMQGVCRRSDKASQPRLPRRQKSGNTQYRAVQCGAVQCSAVQERQTNQHAMMPHLTTQSGKISIRK
jgi:hypothetical protein